MRQPKIREFIGTTRRPRLPMLYLEWVRLIESLPAEVAGGTVPEHQGREDGEAVTLPHLSHQGQAGTGQ